MARKLFLCFGLFLMGEMLPAQIYQWTQKASLPSVARMGAASFSIGTKGYTVGGYTGTAVLKETWEYDQQTNSWSQKADLTGSVRYNASGFAINGKGYVCLGWSNTTGSGQLKDLWEYDPSTNSWTSKTFFPGSTRYTASVFVIGTAAYVGLGYAPLASDFYRYEPLFNLWTQVASFPAGARQSATGFAVNGMGYVLAGNKANQVYYDDLWMYNPNVNQWVQKASIPGGQRLSCVAFVLGNEVFAGLGALPLNTHHDFYNYDYVTDTWITVDSFPGTGRFNAATFSIDKSGFMAFGQHDSAGSVFLNQLWEFRIVSGLSLNENTDEGKIFYVDYKNSMLHITTAFSSELMVHDINGKLIMKLPLKKGINRIDFSTWKSGIKILNIEKNRVQSGFKLFIP